jgi:hypothetical protein
MNKGSSHGDGKLFLHPMASPVNITGDINIHTLNFKDFGISLTKLATAENISQLPAQSDEMLSKWVDPIRQTLKAIEGRVAVSIDHITLDKTQGNMEITTLFGQGKAELVRSKMQGDHGGKADISGALDLSDNNLMAVSAQVTGKDIYYHYDHPSVKKISGHMDLDVDLTTAALPKENELLKALRGNVSFKSHPEFGEFMLFDLWGGGIIQTLAQSVGAIEKSKINCAAGLLTFDDGELKINPVLIDSTRVRVNASLAANLISGEIEGYAKPVPKDPALLRNWLPMTVSGTLTNPSVKPQEGAAVVTAARWFYALPAFVLDLATVDHMAKDGRADCEKVFQYRTQSVGHAN